MQSEEEIRRFLLKRLFEEYAFWSYEKESCEKISDYSLIKHVLIHLDLEEINLLFKIFPRRLIKRVWLDELVPQGDYLKNMNICFAIVYFDIKQPVTYLKRMETYKLNQFVQ